MREYSEDKRLDNENVYLILNGELSRPPKKDRTPTVKVAKNIYARYFKPEQSAKEVQDVVEKALDYYFAHLQSQKQQTESPSVDLLEDEDVETEEAKMSEQIEMHRLPNAHSGGGSGRNENLNRYNMNRSEIISTTFTEIKPSEGLGPSRLFIRLSSSS